MVPGGSDWELRDSRGDRKDLEMRRGLYWVMALGLLWAPRVAGAWCTAEQFVEAIGIPSGDITSISIVGSGSQEMLNRWG